MEGVNAHCSCGLECEVTAEPIWKALTALYEACGARAREGDKLIFSDDDEDCHINGYGLYNNDAIKSNAIKSNIRVELNSASKMLNPSNPATALGDRSGKSNCNKQKNKNEHIEPSLLA